MGEVSINSSVCSNMGNVSFTMRNSCVFYFFVWKKEKILSHLCIKYCLRLEFVAVALKTLPNQCFPLNQQCEHSNIQEEELLGKQVKIIILRTKKWPNLEYDWYVFQQLGCKNKPESRQYNCYLSNWWYKVEFSVPATGLEMTIILRSEQKNDFIWNVQTVCKYTTEHKNVSGYFLFCRFCLFQRFC